MHLRIGQHLQRNEVLVNKAAPSSVLREAEATIPTTPPVRAAAAGLWDHTGPCLELSQEFRCLHGFHLPENSCREPLRKQVVAMCPLQLLLLLLLLVLLMPSLQCT